MSPDVAERDNSSPDEAEPGASVRGWQALAEQRGQQLAAARAETDAIRGEMAAYEWAAKVRQLAESYPDGFESLMKKGGDVTPDMEREVEAAQFAIEQQRDLMPIDPNNPRRNQAAKEPANSGDWFAELGKFPPSAFGRD